MGANMARRLKEVGYPVTAVYDVRAAAAQSIAQEIGCEACVSLARVTALSDVVITVVTDDKAMLNIFTNKKDNLLQGAAGKVFINCATISPKVHVEVAKLAKKAKAATLEACMASSINQARAGTLYLMCGGEEAKPLHRPWLPLAVSIVVVAALVYGTFGLPAFSDPQAPIHVHVVPRYLNEALKETGVPNVVTAVLASYRGYDTLGETTVVFTAGIGVIALLRRVRHVRRRKQAA